MGVDGGQLAPKEDGRLWPPKPRPKRIEMKTEAPIFGGVRVGSNRRLFQPTRGGRCFKSVSS